MSGSYTASRVDAILAAHGEPVTLSRPGEDTTIDLYAKRHERGTGGEIDLGNSAAQTELHIKIGIAALAASAWIDKFPKRFDKVLIGGRTRTVTNVDTRTHGAVAVAHMLIAIG
jgi:hypothetical protein